MIGYMRPIKGAFDKEQRKIYQAVYCGLCRILKSRYGATGTLALNYEIVDMLLMIDSICSDKSKWIKRSCSLSPFMWRNLAGLNEQRYFMAAEISMIIANFEIQDNVEDLNRVQDKILLAISDYKLRKMGNQGKDVYEILEKKYLEYMSKERMAQKVFCGFESVVNACGGIIGTIGRLLSEVSGIREISDIEKIFNLWGRWVYLVDAADDYVEDKKYDHFNPWTLKDTPPNWENYVYCLEKEAGTLINYLPVRRYGDLLKQLYVIQLPERRRRIFNKLYEQTWDTI